MDKNNPVITTALVIAIVALLVSLVCGYLYINQPQSTDLSGIESDIASINDDIIDLGEEIHDIDIKCDCDVNEDDLEDLEELIEDNEDDISDVEDDVDDLQGILSCMKACSDSACMRSCIPA